MKKKIIKSNNIANANLDGWLNNHAIVIENKKVKEIISQSIIPETSSFKVIDFGNSYAIPGIIETHAHLQFSATPEAYEIYFEENEDQRYQRAVKNAETALMSGVTSLRDLGSPNNLIFPIHNDIKNGKIKGPNIYPTGTPLTIKDGHCWFFGATVNNINDILFEDTDQSYNIYNQFYLLHNPKYNLAYL